MMGLVGRGLPSVAVDGGVVAAGDVAGVALERILTTSLATESLMVPRGLAPPST